MPRYKTKKRTNQHQMTSSTLTNFHKSETEFLATPRKLTAQLSKEISAYKAKTKQAKLALQKNKKELKKIQTLIKNKTKHTATGKKEWRQAKKDYATALKTGTGLTKHLQDLSKTLSLLTTKQAKLNALKKYLAQFDKEWKNQQKKTKVTKPKVAVRTKTKEPKSHTKLPQYIPTQVETIDTIVDNVITETAEVES